MQHYVSAPAAASSPITSISSFYSSFPIFFIHRIVLPRPRPSLLPKRSVQIRSLSHPDSFYPNHFLTTSTDAFQNLALHRLFSTTRMRMMSSDICPPCAEIESENSTQSILSTENNNSNNNNKNNNKNSKKRKKNNRRSNRDNNNSDKRERSASGALPRPPAAVPRTTRKHKVAIFLSYVGKNYNGFQTQQTTDMAETVTAKAAAGTNADRDEDGVAEPSDTEVDKALDSGNLNQAVVTIEDVLEDAIYKAGYISQDNHQSFMKLKWSRAARTDKGVSAAGQIVSLKIQVEKDQHLPPSPSTQQKEQDQDHDNNNENVGRLNRVAIVNNINRYLPQDIRVADIKKVTSSFSAYTLCDSRRYLYFIPRSVFFRTDLRSPNFDTTINSENFLDKFQEILSPFEGTHLFHNYTHLKKIAGSDIRRYIISIRPLEINLADDDSPSQQRSHDDDPNYYIAVELWGQSFLFNQIRKMIGYALYVYLGYANLDNIKESMIEENRTYTPLAPGLGLILDECIFNGYNSRNGNVHGNIDFKDCQDQILHFKKTQILKSIIDVEREERTMMSWIESLSGYQTNFDPTFGERKRIERELRAQGEEKEAGNE